jgi:tetratricopeptide (TPR) repeat protein
VIELGAPRRNVMATAEVVARAQAQYDAFVAAATEPPLGGIPASAAGTFWQSLGRRYAETGQPARALPALERAVQADPSLPEAQELLGHLYLDRRDYAAAEQAHREYLRLRPARVDAWLRFAAVLARQSKWKEARESIARARTLDPSAPVDPALLAYLDRQVAQGDRAPPPR